MYSFFPSWTETLGDREVAVSLVWPTIAVIGLCLTLTGGILLVWARGPRNPGFGALFGVCSFTAAALPGTAAILTVTAFVGPQGSFAHTFQPLIAAEGAIVFFAGALAAAALGAHFIRGGGEWGATTLGGGALVGSGTLLAASGSFHGLALAGLGLIPSFASTSLGPVHEGHSLGVLPILMYGDTPVHVASTEWVVEEARLEPSAAGVHPVLAVANNHCVRLSQSINVEVGVDRGDPLFPLMVGNEWTYQETTESGIQLLWVMHQESSSLGDRVEVAVTGESLGTPLHTYNLRVTTITPPAPPSVDPARSPPDQPSDGEPPAAPNVETRTAQDIEVFRWNGTLNQRITPEDGPPEISRLVERTADTGWVTPDGEPLVNCSFAVFDGYRCGCLAHPDARARIPGPAICKLHRRGSTAEAIGSGILAVLTAGLVIIDTDDDTELVLTGATGLAER